MRDVKLSFFPMFTFNGRSAFVLFDNFELFSFLMLFSFLGFVYLAMRFGVHEIIIPIQSLFVSCFALYS